MHWIAEGAAARDGALILTIAGIVTVVWFGLGVLAGALLF